MLAVQSLNTLGRQGKSTLFAGAPRSVAVEDKSPWMLQRKGAHLPCVVLLKASYLLHKPIWLEHCVKRIHIHGVCLVLYLQTCVQALHNS